MILDFTSQDSHLDNFSPRAPFSSKQKSPRNSGWCIYDGKNPQKSKHVFFVTGSSRLFTDDEVDEEGTPDLEQNEELPD